MRVLLLTPPARQKSSESLLVPPLGLAYVAAALRQAGYQVSIKDGFAEQMIWRDLESFLEEERPDVLGLSSMSPVIDTVFKAAHLARPYVSTIVMGGPHVSVWGQEVFQQCPEIDFGIIGEGEQTMVEFMGALAAGQRPDAIPGVVGRGFAGPPRPMIKDLDTLPFPARDLLPLSKYRYPFSKASRITTVFTSRGCPFDCSFCDKSVFGSQWRARSAANILAEIDEIVQRFQISSFIIYDDLFTLDKVRTTTICEGILQRGYKLDWKCESRVNLADLEILRLMKRAGCSMIAYGVESGNQHGLDYLNKKIKLEETRRAFALTQQAGIATMAYFILGIPVESFEEELQTIRFAKEIAPTYAQFSILSPYYGTRLYQEAKEKNWYQEVCAHNPIDKDVKRPVVLSPQWNEKNLQKILRRAYLSFYLDPRYIFKRLLAIRSMSQLVNSLRGFLTLGGWLAK
jgi:anaerobic magnesium-protoporphyrin IX monomethyl ester cyclase